MDIDRLQIQIETNADSAVGGIDRLAQSLQSLRGATANSAGLGKVATAFASLKTATQGLKIGNLGAQVSTLTKALQPLQSLGKNNLSSFVNSLKQIPKATENLNVGTTNAFADAIRRVADAVRPLAAEMEKIAMGFSALPARMQRFIAQMNKSGAGATTAAKGYRSMAAALNSINFKAAIAGIMYFGRMVVSTLGRFVNSASQYVEDINLVNISLGEYAGAVSEYAQRAQDLLGIDAAGFMKNVGVFNDIAQGLGVSSDAAVFMSQNLTQLAYDIASFRNISNETAFEKLRSGITGQTRAMMELGVSVHVATLEEVARRHGIEQSVSSMTEAQKVTLRYLAILDATSNAQGDLARTLDSPANQMRIFSQQVQLLSRSLGNLLIPIINKVLPYILAFVKVLRMAAEAIAAFFHISLPAVDTSGIGAVADGIGAAAGSASDFEDNLSGAAKEAKKLKSYVLGIDELNIFSPPEEPASGSGLGSGGAGGGDLGIPLEGYDFLKDLETQADELVPKMEKVAKVLGTILGALVVLKAVKWLAGIVTAFTALGAAADPLAVLLSNMGAALGAISTPALIAGGAILAVAGGLAYVYIANEDVRDSVNKALGGVWTALEKAFRRIAETVLPDLQSGWQGLLDILTPLGVFLSDVFTSIWLDMIVPALNYLSETVIPVLTDTFINLWDNVLVPLGTFVGSVLGPVFSMLAGLLSSLWQNIVVPLATAVGSVLGGAFEALAAIFNNVVIPVVSFVIGLFQFLWDNLLGPIVDFLYTSLSPAFETVFGGIGEIIGNLQTALTGLTDFISGVFSGDWDKAWNGIVDIFKGIFNIIPTIVETVINGVIWLINGLTSGINWLTGWVGIPEIPKIPEVALPRFKMGIDYIPFDDMPALLHRGEAVLTASEASQYRALGGMDRIMTMLAGGSANVGGADIGGAISGASIAGGVSLSDFAGIDYNRMAQAVFEAVSAAMQGDEQSINLTVNLGDEQVYNANLRGARAHGFQIAPVGV